MPDDAQNRFQGEQLAVFSNSRVVRGVQQSYEWVVRPAIVIAVAVTGNQLVTIRQYRPALRQFTLELPAGKVGDEIPYETPRDALVRELAEEASFVPSRIEPVGQFYTAPHFADELCYVFFAEGNVTGNPRPSVKEELTYELVDTFRLEALRSRGDMADAKSLGALLLVHERGLLNWIST